MNLKNIGIKIKSQNQFSLWLVIFHMNSAVEWTNFASCAIQEILALLGRLKRNIFMFHQRVYASHSSHKIETRSKG